MAEIGDNSNASFRLFVERVENLVQERQGINDDIKDVKTEAKANGHNPKMIDYVVKMRKMEREARAELLAEQEAALAALGLA